MATVDENPTVTIELEPTPIVVDEIEIKQKEMRDTIIMVLTNRGGGSGTIIDRVVLDIEEDRLFRYLVLTNVHVINGRFITHIRGANFLTGELKTETVDTGCEVIIFDHYNRTWEHKVAKFVSEDTMHDIAILSFTHEKELTVAKIADEAMIDQVRVFDEIFAIGCQLGRSPSPTTGIISQISIGVNGSDEWVVYSNTAQITPGSSGGGLFRKYDEHYYLIGIPSKIATAHNGQFVSHLSHAISISTARNLINNSLVSR
jgi:S1-C subfamily serine protease